MPKITTHVRAFLTGIIAIVTCTIICGLLYPVAVWGVSRLTSDTAEGSLVYRDGQVLSSRQLDDGRTNADPQSWFYGCSVGLSNLGPSSPELAQSIAERRANIAQRENVHPEQVPADAVTGSGSGADAGISVDYARIQVPRVAKAHGISEAEVTELVEQATTGRGLGVLGEPVVNVTELNLSLPGQPAS